MVLDSPTVLELRTTRSGCSTRGGGRVGSDGFLTLSPVTQEGSDAGGLTGTAVSDESPCSTSQLTRPGGIRSGGGGAGRGGFLILSLTSDSEEAGVGMPTKATLLYEGCDAGGARFESFRGKQSE